MSERLQGDLNQQGGDCRVATGRQLVGAGPEQLLQQIAEPSAGVHRLGDPVHSGDLLDEDLMQCGREAMGIQSRTDDFTQRMPERQSLRSLDGFREDCHDLPRVIVDERGHKRFLVRKILVERANDDSRALGDPCRGCMLIAISDQNLSRSLEKHVERRPETRLTGAFRGFVSTCALLINADPNAISETDELMAFRRDGNCLTARVTAMSAMSNKVALVTGASSGIGQATADYLAAQGDRVYGTSRSPKADHGRAWTMLPLDVCDDASVAECVKEVKRAEGRIDVLVNNAGHAFVGAVEETGLRDMKAQMETNFFGAFRMMHATVPIMRVQNSGRIINVSSIAGRVPWPFLGAYSASKHALNAITEVLALELRGSGIRLTLIEPEGMKTSIAFHHPGVDHPTLGVKRRAFLSTLEQRTQRDGYDPSILAKAVENAIESEAPPLHVVIGDAANEIFEARRTMSDVKFADMIAGSLQLDAETVPA
jgi:NAD(P)-dependent dehydrogenase (short-subunit alcohol dehydrogenase family)